MTYSTRTIGENQVLAAAESGHPADLSGLRDDQLVVSPDLIRYLCVGAAAKNVHSWGLRIINARIVEPLDLSFCTVPHPLCFKATRFDAAPNLSWARLPALWMMDCWMLGLICNGIRINELRLGSSDTSGKPSVTGEVSLLRAKIDGNLDCDGATLMNKDGNALVADGAEINGDVFLRKLRATGAVQFHRAKIGGNLNCYCATLTNERGHALVADGAEINGDVLLRKFTATGDVRFPGAKIGGNLDCRAATLTKNKGCALTADGAEVDGSVILSNYAGAKFRATGVRLVSAKIGQDLDCSGAILSNECGDDTASSPEAKGYAVMAAGIEIRGNAFLSECSASGVVWFHDASIGGSLECSGATLDNASGWALTAEGAEISDNVRLDNSNHKKFSATGVVRLLEAKIGGWLQCEDATLVNRDAENEGGIALDAGGARMSGGLIFRSVRVTGGVDLSRASATTLYDDLGDKADPLGSWRGIEPLDLNGFAYARFGDESDAKRRTWWLEQLSRFQYGAWQQLIAVYRAQGRGSDATRAAIAMHNDRARRRPWYRAAGRWVLWAVVGHGYRAWLAGCWALLIIVGFGFLVRHYAHHFHPVKGATDSSLQPFAYAADRFLPVVDLGPASDWKATGWIRWVDWNVVLLGWALTTIFVAGFTRIVRGEAGSSASEPV